MMLQRAYRPNAGAYLRFHAPARTIRSSAPRWTRPNSSSTGPSPSSSSNLPKYALGAASVAAGWFIADVVRDRGNGNGKPTGIPSSLEPGTLPSLGSGPVDLDALAKTPVDGGSFETADAKLREDVFVGSFTAEGKHTHVHAARVASNHPVEDVMTFSLGPGVGKSETLYNGVYDGHAGWATSLLLKSALIPAVSSSIAQLSRGTEDAAVEIAIVKAFTNLDDLITSNAQKAIAGLKTGAVEPADPKVIAAIAPAIAGSCALLSIFDPATSTLRVACTGDSRAVLGSIAPGATSYSARALSKDQTGHNKDEFDRIAKEHPGEEAEMIDTKSGRLFGIAITRAFGDHRWKWTADAIKEAQNDFFGTGVRPKYLTPPYMTAAPVVTTVTEIKGPDFVILASDGLWDHISSEHAVECVSRWITAKKAGEKTPRDKLAVTPGVKSEFDMSAGWANWYAKPEHFVVEDLDNAAVHLIKNALGGTRRSLFTGVTLAYPPLARNVRDDVTVQVIFFQDPAKEA
ncbi:protein phosphatase 2C [Colletotrichum abscissum]|uniref:Protein phosphatase 2C n=1 Tax=Colletotrichum abscissum TaxID=1671311 RepID=A0A9P9X9D0_9PEZI|nr:protein phosphatase 2C [Colletotrichum abscissum]KAI3542902.1 protein phosphatase 2C [Colletotrichum abscissum]KAK1513722.1 protein phosphatase 2C [Colletotrichum abscissum]